MNQSMERITINSDVCNGRPTIRNMRFTVAQLLELLAAGMSEDEVLADYNYLESEDIKACLQYAAHIANTRTIIPLAQKAA